MNKFYDYLLLHIKELDEEIKEIESKKDNKKIFNELRNSKDPRKFLSFYNDLMEVDKSFKEDLDIIKYLVDNKQDKAEQLLCRNKGPFSEFYSLYAARRRIYSHKRYI